MSHRLPVLVTGATGFIGSAIRRLAPSGQKLTLMTRARPGAELASHEAHRAADITEPHEVESAVAGAGSIIHCASYVGSDAGLAWRVNDRGTRHVVEAARFHGVRQITYVSTTGVYGRGEIQSADETHPTSPASEASRSRLAAERHVLDAGGTVIRPHLVYGHGDRWVIPLLVRLALAYGLQDADRVRVSFIKASELAAQVWALHQFAELAPAAVVVNADHGAPTNLSDAWKECETKLDLANHLDQLAVTAGAPGPATHQREMLSTDRWFASRLQSLGIHISTTAFCLDQTMVRWYLHHLGLEPSRELEVRERRSA